jgi:hypothetical protein
MTPRERGNSNASERDATGRETPRVNMARGLYEGIAGVSFLEEDEVVYSDEVLTRFLRQMMYLVVAASYRLN